MSERAPFLVDDADVPALRRAVSEVGRTGYCEAAVRERLGLGDLCDLHWRNLPVYRDERLAERDTMALAIDLFLLQGGLTTGELDRLLPASSREVLLRTALLEIEETGVARARASLVPVGRRLIFADHAWPELPHPGHATVPSDQVMAAGLDSRYLARATVRRPVRSALDVCTGSGVHALLAASHARRVCAVDINPRAVRCTRFNARALGIANLEAVEGDLFDPVGGERFDLITANPPFVPSPVNTLWFRDGGPTGEDVQKRIVAGLPHHLAPGGMAQLVTELGEREGEPVACRLRQWLAGAPMDIHVLRVASHTAAQYAAGHAKGGDYASFLDSARAWAANLRAQGYARVVTVLVAFQWSSPASSAPWERIDQSRPPWRSAGAEIEAAFLAERLARTPDLHRHLEGSWLRRAGPVALLEASVLGGAIAPKARATRLGQALEIEHELEPLERQLLAAMERRVAASELLRLCREFDAPEPAVLEAIRSLLRKRLASIDIPSEKLSSSG
ncbi:MAG: methyltransferase [Bryobacteraceae bacterium]|jgi:SAM-dependent methyltransferase